MKKINDLLFIIENYIGVKECNGLSTEEELAAFLGNKGLSDNIDDALYLLNNEKSCYNWLSLNTVNSLLEFRRCKDEQDLCDFLDGKYNDSIEKMHSRGLHTLGVFNGFEQELKVSFISPISISLLSSLKEKSPVLKSRCMALFEEKSSVDDIIRNCVQNRSSVQTQNESRFKSQLHEH